MLNYKVKHEPLMLELQHDKRAMALLQGRSLRHTVYQTLEEWGDPRRWPEYLDNLHEVVDID